MKYRWIFTLSIAAALVLSVIASGAEPERNRYHQHLEAEEKPPCTSSIDEKPLYLLIFTTFSSPGFLFCPELCPESAEAAASLRLSVLLFITWLYTFEYHRGLLDTGPFLRLSLPQSSV